MTLVSFSVSKLQWLLRCVVMSFMSPPSPYSGSCDNTGFRCGEPRVALTSYDRRIPKVQCSPITTLLYNIGIHIHNM